MKTVFISGSRKISRINNEVRERLKNILSQHLSIIVGDANGADKAFQKYLSENRYDNVVVFCSGGSCRNNLGNWRVKSVSVDSKLKGRDFYTQKDKEMAAEADYGFVLWDGKSPGSFNNIMELLKKGKKSLVYFTPEKEFYPVSGLDDAQQLLKKCDPNILSEISKKVKLTTAMREIESKRQESLCF